MLDIYATFFSLLSILLFIKSLDDKKFFFATYVSIGLALACKWIAIFVFFAILIYYLLKKDVKNFALSLLGIILSIGVYCLTYLTFFLNGYGFQEFISLQIKMYNFQHFMRFERGVPPSFWILLNFLTGIEGPTEHAVIEIIQESGSLIVKTLSVKHGLSLIKAFNPFTWPSSFSSSIMSFYYARKRRDENFQLIPIAFLTLIGLTSYGQVFIWYLLPVLPLGFISLGYFIENVYKDAKNKKLAACLIIVYTFILLIWSFTVSLSPFILTA